MNEESLENNKPTIEIKKCKRQTFIAFYILILGAAMIESLGTHPSPTLKNSIKSIKIYL
jgi:hypothetical protein